MYNFFIREYKNRGGYKVMKNKSRVLILLATILFGCQLSPRDGGEGGEGSSSPPVTQIPHRRL